MKLAQGILLMCAVVLLGVARGLASPSSGPGFHFRPAQMWMNDPNGPMYYKGLYHLFYQYNPYEPKWGDIVWAHSVSHDLVSWTALEPAIKPSKAFDMNGCWSGSATLLPSGVPVLMYTGVDAHKEQVQNVAYPANLSDHLLRNWSKPDYNPVMTAGRGVNSSAFRDPTTAWLGPDKLWRVVVGSNDGGKGLAVLYRSRDFKKWIKARHMLHSGSTGMWECPDFYPVAVAGGSRDYRRGVDVAELRDRVVAGEVKYVLKVSLDLKRYDYYNVGGYDHATDEYVPGRGYTDNDMGLRYDYGNFYASKSFYDPVKRRRIVWGWANESDAILDDYNKGWAGIQAIPRQVWLSPSGDQLIQWPVEEVEALRQKHVNLTSRVVKGGQHFEVTGLNSVQSDVEVVFELTTDMAAAELFDPAWRMDAQALCARLGAHVRGGLGPFGLFTLASSDLGETTAVFFRVFKAQNNTHVVHMCNDATRSSYKQDTYRPPFAAFINMDIAKTKKIKLRTLIDHSVVESFGAEGRACILSRVYPTRAIGDEARLFVFNNGESDVKLAELHAWEMKSPKINVP